MLSGFKNKNKTPKIYLTLGVLKFILTPMGSLLPYMKSIPELLIPVMKL
jgi:hypothetical protein